MKRIFFALLAFAAIAITAAAKGDGASICIDERSYDFGTIQESKGPVSHDFVFRNTGSEPLVIHSVVAGCGCTKPSYPTEPIKPGKKAKITITYNPAGRPGEFNRTVKVRTNDKKNRKFNLNISGVVTPK